MEFDFGRLTITLILFFWGLWDVTMAGKYLYGQLYEVSEKSKGVQSRSKSVKYEAIHGDNLTCRL